MTGFMNSDGSALVGGLLPSGVGEALQLDSSGNLKIVGSIAVSNPSTGTNGAAIPTSSTLVGGSDGTNLQPLKLDSSGRLTLIPNSSVNMAQIAGVAPGLDNTNELRVSAYGKNAAAGDTPMLTDASGNQLVKLVAGSALAGGVNVVDSAGTNKLAVDASGRLTLVPNSSVNVAQVGGSALALGQTTKSASLPVTVASDQGNLATNIAQWNGSAPSVTNPVIMEDQIRAWIINSQGFTATTGFQTAAASSVGASLYNPNASGKTLYVYSIRCGLNGSLKYTVQTGITSDPALASSMVAVNSKNAGAAPAANATYANTTTTFGTGSASDNVTVSGNTIIEALAPGQIIVVPANSGIGVSIPSSSDIWNVNFKWLEI